MAAARSTKLAFLRRTINIVDFPSSITLSPKVLRSTGTAREFVSVVIKRGRCPCHSQPEYSNLPTARKREPDRIEAPAAAYWIVGIIEDRLHMWYIMVAGQLLINCRRCAAGFLNQMRFRDLTAYHFRRFGGSSAETPQPSASLSTARSCCAPLHA